MLNIFRPAITLFFLGHALFLSAQQSLMFSQMTEFWQANSINPALTLEKSRVMLTTGGLGLHLDHSGDAAYEDLIRTENGKKVLDLGQLIDRLEDQNTLNYRQRLETVSLGIRLPGPGKTTVQVGHAVLINAQINYPKTLPGMLWYGNGPYIGQDVPLAFSANTYDWNELSAGVSRRFGKLRVGIRGKYLSGIGSLYTNPDANQLSLYTDPDVYQLTLKSNFGFYSSGFIAAIDTQGFGLNVVTGEIKNRLDGKNSGRALDIGIQFDATEKLHIFASALDLGGTIKWDSGTKYFASQGEFQYNGIEILGSDIINGADSLGFQGTIDSLLGAFNFQSSASSYTSRLPRQYYVGVQYELFKRLVLGLSAQIINDGDQTNKAVGVSARFKPFKWLSAGAQYSVNDESADNLGFQLGFRPGPVQLYFATDDLLNAFAPQKQSSANLRLGLAWVF